MAWTTPFTAVSNTALTAAIWNSGVRDNFAETEPAKASSTGGLLVTTGANAIVQRTPTRTVISTAQTTTSSTLVDLTTAGPAVTVTTGTRAIIILSSYIQNSTAGAGGYMAFAVSGATTTAADGNRSLRIMSAISAENQKESYMGFVSLNAGSNTFTAKYAAVGGGTASYSERELSVIPL